VGIVRRIDVDADDVAIVVDADRLREPAAVCAEVLESSGFRPAKGASRPVGQHAVPGNLAVVVDRQAHEITGTKRSELVYPIRDGDLRADGDRLGHEDNPDRKTHSTALEHLELPG
jgi:hypothetical protein